MAPFVPKFITSPSPLVGSTPTFHTTLDTFHLIGGRILETMVGTGRLLIPLLEAAINVEGIDSSLDMLAACRKHCADRNLNPILHQGCVEKLDIPGKFSA